MGVVLLVRHGQASFGSADYDCLSPLGVRQAQSLGAALRTSGFAPDIVISGSLRRQASTAEEVVRSAGWPEPVRLDPDWNEFDHLGLMGIGDAAAHRDGAAFQGALDRALHGWTAGEYDPIAETFDDFSGRATRGFDTVVTRLRPGGNALVVSSAGVISRIATTLLGGSPEQWIRLQRVSVNAGCSRVTVGRAGANLVSFNEQGHLGEALRTYR